jgi:hypothetical protein
MDRTGAITNRTVLRNTLLEDNVPDACWSTDYSYVLFGPIETWLYGLLLCIVWPHRDLAINDYVVPVP